MGKKNMHPEEHRHEAVAAAAAADESRSSVSRSMDYLALVAFGLIALVTTICSFILYIIWRDPVLGGDGDEGYSLVVPFTAYLLVLYYAIYLVVACREWRYLGLVCATLSLCVAGWLSSGSFKIFGRAVGTYYHVHSLMTVLGLQLLVLTNMRLAGSSICLRRHSHNRAHNHHKPKVSDISLSCQ